MSEQDGDVQRDDQPPPTMQTHSIVEVLGRWAYTEVVKGEGTLAAHYDNRDGVEELRKQRQDGAPYDALTNAEKHLLAFLCAVVRPVPFTLYASAIRRFELIQLTKDQLSALLVMPQVDAALNGKFVRFEDFAISPAPKSPKDCRNVKQPAGEYTKPVDALTVGGSPQSGVLIDGYHRAMAFMRWASQDATIAAYVPHS
jgi:hypothetical protein